MGRSYWDLEKQNELIVTLKDYFGGTFDTDEGKNTLYINDYERYSLISSGLYIARWSFHNALTRVKIYLDARGLRDGYRQIELTGLPCIDTMNPMLFSNNLVIPYLVAIWEHYLKASYTAVLKNNCNLDKVLKHNKLTVDETKRISSGEVTVEEVISNKLSFQRPKIVGDNFKMIEDKIDIFKVLKSNQVEDGDNLFDFITRIIEIRNEFVHTGEIHHEATNEYIKTITQYFERAVDSIYDRFGEFYSFEPLRDY